MNLPFRNLVGRNAMIVSLVISYIAIRTSPAFSAWRVDEHNLCVKARDLARGPRTMLTALILPAQSASIAFLVFGEEGRISAGRVAFFVPLALGFGVIGAIEAPFVFALGVADTVTGGYYQISPEHPLPATAPWNIALGDAPPPPTQDKCGRLKHESLESIMGSFRAPLPTDKLRPVQPDSE